MNMRQFEHFVAVAEEQNFTRAARRVCIAQSALSTSIRGLEAQFGCALLHRSPRHAGAGNAQPNRNCRGRVYDPKAKHRSRRDPIWKCTAAPGFSRCCIF